jgi:hypothetical protein
MGQFVGCLTGMGDAGRALDWWAGELDLPSTIHPGVPAVDLARFWEVAWRIDRDVRPVAFATGRGANPFITDDPRFDEYDTIGRFADDEGADEIWGDGPGSPFRSSRDALLDVAVTLDRGVLDQDGWLADLALEACLDAQDWEARIRTPEDTRWAYELGTLRDALDRPGGSVFGVATPSTALTRLLLVGRADHAEQIVDRLVAPAIRGDDPDPDDAVLEQQVLPVLIELLPRLDPADRARITLRVVLACVPGRLGVVPPVVGAAIDAGTSPATLARSALAQGVDVARAVGRALAAGGSRVARAGSSLRRRPSADASRSDDDRLEPEA